VLLILGALAGCAQLGAIAPSSFYDKLKQAFGKPAETPANANSAPSRHRNMALRPSQRADGAQQGTVAHVRAPAHVNTLQQQRGAGVRTAGQTQPNPEIAGGNGGLVTCQPLAGARPFLCRPEGKGVADSKGTASNVSTDGKGDKGGNP